VWLTAGNMDDYILLNFQTSIPRKVYRGTTKLFHVVFTNDFSFVTMYNHLLETVEEFALLES